LVDKKKKKKKTTQARLIYAFRFISFV